MTKVDFGMRIVLLVILSACWGTTIPQASGFTASTTARRRIQHSNIAPSRKTTDLLASRTSNGLDDLRIWTAVSLFTVASIMAPTHSFADEIGQEREAPTFGTGETVEICVKRGPLGACQKTELRTESNDNDIARKYFRDPSDLIKQREAALRAESEDAGNALIQKLRQQSLDNQEKNDLYVARKTFEADQVRYFMYFDSAICF